MAADTTEPATVPLQLPGTAVHFGLRLRKTHAVAKPANNVHKEHTARLATVCTENHWRPIIEIAFPKLKRRRQHPNQFVVVSTQIQMSANNRLISRKRPSPQTMAQHHDSRPAFLVIRVIEAEMVGYGANGDAYHITPPDENQTGVVRVMQLALADAGIDRERVRYINAHGTSTPLGDRGETRAIKKLSALMLTSSPSVPPNP
jgi:hypothetical protein